MSTVTTLSGGFSIRSIRVNGEQVAGSHVRVCRSDRVWAPLGSESAVWGSKPPKSHGLGLFPRVPQKETGGIQRTATLPTEHTKVLPSTVRIKLSRRLGVLLVGLGASAGCLEMLLGDVPAVSVDLKVGHSQSNIGTWIQS